MSKQYPGGIISKTPPVPTQVAASGVWTLDQQAYWQKLGQWPTPGYKIQRSLRFNSADSAYLNRTPASASNRKTWTWSGWVKRSSLPGTSQVLFGTASAGSNNNSCQIRFNTNNKLEVFDYVSAFNFNYVSTQVFRDVSAWYHVVAVLDTTQATSSNRVKVYINGIQITAFDSITEPSLNLDALINSTVSHGIGRGGDYADLYFSGYMTEVNFIDGQALTPSSFGETNADTGVWSPMPYTGAYGTNGFYLNFSDNSNTTATTLGKDYSGNGNNWTPNNFSVTAGVGNDSMVDTPTPYGTDTGAGGSVRGNYCTLNALQKGSTVNIANGNLDVSNSTSGGAGKILGTIGVSSGKWYAEATMSGSGGMPGISEFTANLSQYPGGDAQSWGYNNGGQKYHNGSGVNYGATFTTNDVIGIALDMDTGAITFYKNNVSQGVAYNTGIAGKTITFAGRGDTTTTESWNFGQRPFAYTAPSGFKALCTQNLPTPTIGATSTTLAGKYFNAVLWTGTGTQTRSITGLDFQPDLTWMKIRADTPQGHQLYDVVRGAGGGKNLSSNTTAAEGTVNGFPDSDYGYVSSFDSGGFSVNDGAVATTGGYVNYSGRTYVAWNWKANGAGSTNTSGSITSTVSANTTSGFSVVTYTGTGANATVGHGLGVAPSMVIIKARSFTQVWVVGHSSIGFGNYLLLNATDASASGSNVFNSTAPTSTVFSLGSGGGGNQSAATYVAYCFAPVAGYSAFGSYTGNGSADGPFIYTGFRPAFVMVKNTAAGENWVMLDATRNTSNVTNNKLAANSSAVENDASIGDSTQNNFDFLSNGFKAVTTNSGTNGSSAVIIYMAFAQNPFKYSLAR